MSRPEDILPPDLYYNDVESRKYTTSSRVQSIQESMTQRALELLDLDAASLILDIGCGSGLSGEILTEEGHMWIGMDISASMLAVALDREVEGDLFLADMGQGIPFRAGTFDAAISISAIQWLCNAEDSESSPAQRLKRFFDGLYSSLRRGARAVCQFYPKNQEQKEMISGAAVKAGFSAGLLEDDPGTKNCKVYLVLNVGSDTKQDITNVVRNLDGVNVEDPRTRKSKNRAEGTRKTWILKKKEKSRRKGMVVKPDTKYTGRKRRIQF